MYGLELRLGCMCSLLISLYMGQSCTVELELSSLQRLRVLVICRQVVQIPVQMTVARVRLMRWALVDCCWF